MSIKNNTPYLQGILDTINTLPDYVDTTGTATAADIYTGKTATVNDKKLTGTNPYNAANVDPAVADALAALVEKGVDTTGAGLAELAALIGGVSGAKIETGSKTYSTGVDSTSNLTIAHSLGKAPDFFLVAVTNRGSSTGAFGGAFYYGAQEYGCYLRYAGGYFYTYFTNTISADADNLVIDTNNVTIVLTGCTLHWIAGCI